jgi:hypothetical protein
MDHEDKAQGELLEKLTKETDSPQKSSMVDLHRGTDIQLEDAITMIRHSLTRIIVLAGEVGSGKTTLLASLYENFLRGPFAGYYFSGSYTLPGFEKRSHHARVLSGRITADTERTKPTSDKGLLHLMVRIQNMSQPSQNLLFSDISGETFEMARDYSDECRKMEILRRADHVVLLMDGEKLSKKEQRHEVFINGEMFLRRCFESGMLSKRSFIDVLFTKYDLLKETADTSQKEFLDYITKRLTDRYEKECLRFRLKYVAARPRNESKLALASGLETIFPNWVEDTPFLERRSSATAQFELKTEMERFLWKQLGHQK